MRTFCLEDEEQAWAETANVLRPGDVVYELTKKGTNAEDNDAIVLLYYQRRAVAYLVGYRPVFEFRTLKKKKNRISLRWSKSPKLQPD
jgi:hypothetical protein